MVSGLVQKQHIGLGQQESRQRNAATLTPGQCIDVSVPGRQAQCVGGNLEACIKIVRVLGLNDVLESGLFLRQRVKIGVGLGVVRVDFL